MDDTEYRPISIQPPTAVKKDRTKLIIFLIIAILIVGGYFFFRNSTKEEATEETVITPTISEKPSPTPKEEVEESPTPEVNEDETPTPSPIPTTGTVESSKDLNIQILNGSGEVGVAGNIKTYLADKGYKNLFTGNADNFNYENVTINIKSSRKTYSQSIQDDLSGDYTVNDTIGTLAADSEYDAQIIIGK